MNIVFWILVIAVAALIWMGCSSCFESIGEFFCGLWGGAADAMSETKEFEEDDEIE